MDLLPQNEHTVISLYTEIKATLNMSQTNRKLMKTTEHTNIVGQDKELYPHVYTIKAYIMKVSNL